MLLILIPKPRWQLSKPSLFMRQVEIGSAMAQLLLDIGWDWLFSQNTSLQRKRRAKWLVKTLLNLGPTFIKIGQSLSTRADLIPYEYIEELIQLQDRVPAFSVSEAIALIESELDNSIYALFRDFDQVPLAAASLGQVHRARLHTGEEVVVKVQRPGLEQLFNLDFKIINQLLQFCYKYLPWTRNYDLDIVYDQYKTILYQEIDYIIEGKNAEKFAENFHNYPNILIPKIYWRCTRKKILTVQYLPGIKINDVATLEASGIDPKKINQIGICCYLKQLLIDGYFQADPHPGNLAVSKEGNIIFYDFGMMVEIKGIAKEDLLKTLFAIFKKDTDTVLETLIKIGLIERVGDLTPVKRILSFLLEKFTDKPIDVNAFGEIRIELWEMFEQQPFRLPAEMTFILKALTTLDGIARALEPEYNITVAAQPFIKSLSLTKGNGNLVTELAKQTKDLIRERWNRPSAAKMIYHLEQRLERGELQIRVRDVEADHLLRQINLGIKTLIYIGLSGLTLILGTLLLIGSYNGLAIAVFCISSLAFLGLMRTILTLFIKERLDKISKK